MDLAKITTAPDPGTAAIIKSMLESAGIPVLLQSENAPISLLLFAGTGGGPGPVDIMVPAECAADATALIAATEPDRADD